MNFNSIEYAVFLPMVFLIYWILPGKFRWMVLLISSYYFYMSWNAKYVFLILFSTIISYACALLIEYTNKTSLKRAALLLAITSSLGILYVFKYFDFSMSLIGKIIPIRPVSLKLLLPVGISFYTFQTLSYVIDVYHGKVKPEKNIGIYATFVAFFPQLVAGPIERTENLLPQIKNARGFDYNNAAYGVRLILWGLYKKMVVADNLAIWVDTVYSDLELFKGFSLLIAAFFFSLQIYCDFSGYSDIARGSAKLLNIDLMENFKSPYFSSSIREFWQRWHISLSTWFRDYVYIPLGGNRCSKAKNIFNTMITFLASGLWHGANLTFLAWGGVHGIGQVCEKELEKKNSDRKQNGFHWIIRVICVFCFVTFAQIFFRADTVWDALYIFKNMFNGLSNPSNYVISAARVLEIGKWQAVKIAVLYIFPLLTYDFISLKTDVCAWIGTQKYGLQCIYIAAMLFLILKFSYLGQSNFVYFQF